VTWRRRARHRARHRPPPNVESAWGTAVVFAFAVALATGCGVKAAPRPPVASVAAPNGATDGGAPADAGTP
jgi:hypothetical protein